MNELLIELILRMFPVATFVANFQNLVDQLRPGIWNAAVSINATPRNAVSSIVELAIAQGWVDPLVASIPRNPGNAGEIAALERLLAQRFQPTSSDVFDEVLLEGDRPFVNRKELRARLKMLCAGGSTLLLVSGQPKTGKSFSFYLAQHTARKQGLLTSQFEVRHFPRPDQLAAEVLDRIGEKPDVLPQGSESAERWAEKLAGQVARALQERNTRHLFVFDEFPSPSQPPLPAETASFIVRLAKYADEELRPRLGVMLIQFTGPLPANLEDVAERDEAQPFTDADMLAVFQQVRKARGWNVSDDALLAEIHAASSRASELRGRFQFMRQAIRRLNGGGP